MTVSVVVPSFNGARWLGDQLAALSAQTYESDWELVVVDNGSTDATPEIARTRAERVPSFRLVGTPRPSCPAHGRNVGAAAASGHKLLFCDHDDVVDPGWLSSLAGALETHRLATGPVRSFVGAAPPDDPEPAPTEVPMIGPFVFLVGTNVAMTHDLFDELGGFDERLRCADDVDLGIRAPLRGVDVGSAPRAVAWHRRPDTARAMWRKEYAYGRELAIVERRYPQAMPSGWLRAAFRRLGWVAVRAPYVASRHRRRVLVGRAASLSGRVAERLRPSE